MTATTEQIQYIKCCTHKTNSNNLRHEVQDSRNAKVNKDTSQYNLQAVQDIQ